MKKVAIAVDFGNDSTLLQTIAPSAKEARETVWASLGDDRDRVHSLEVIEVVETSEVPAVSIADRVRPVTYADIRKWEDD